MYTDEIERAKVQVVKVNLKYIIGDDCLLKYLPRTVMRSCLYAERFAFDLSANQMLNSQYFNLETCRKSIFYKGLTCFIKLPGLYTVSYFGREICCRCRRRAILSREKGISYLVLRINNSFLPILEPHQ